MTPVSGGSRRQGSSMGRWGQSPRRAACLHPPPAATVFCPLQGQDLGLREACCPHSRALGALWFTPPWATSVGAVVGLPRWGGVGSREGLKLRRWLASGACSTHVVADGSGSSRASQT